MLKRPLAALSLLTIAFGSAASAAPFLGSKGSFVNSAFCKAHTCTHMATVPSGYLDQFHYDVDKKYRVVVWRYPTDMKRLWGPDAAPYAGQVRGVGMEWYGVQDTPFSSQGFLAQLMTFATGKSTTAATALKIMGEGKEEHVMWGNFHIFRENRVLPGANASWMSVTAMVDAFK